MKKYTKIDSAGIILKRLSEQYPDAKIELKFTNDIELLVATILSAQCTDIRVNAITGKLFLKYKTALDYANADLAKLEKEIRPVGLFRSKTKNIIKAAEIICRKYQGDIPREIKQLVALPGIGRKTANVILFNAFGKNEGIAVDTHVKRLSRRIGMTLNDDPDKIEQDLMRIIPKRQWGKLNHLFIAHGRNICTAHKPKCAICCINKFCTYYKQMIRGKLM